MPCVLFVHHRPQPSGAAQSLALLIEALGDEWDAHVLVPGGGAAELFAAAGATVHRAPVPAFTHTWDVQYHGLRWLVAGRELLSLPAHRRALRRLLRELRPAVVHLNDSVMLPSAMIAHRGGVPVAFHLRSSLPHGGRDRRSRWIARAIDRVGAVAIAIDDDVARTFHLKLRVHVIGNPVVTAEGAPADLGVPGGQVSVGFIGYLRRQKGWPEFLGALQLLVRDNARVHGVVVGGGVRPHRAFRGPRGRLLEALGIPDEEGAFARAVDELGLETRVTWLPFTKDMGSIYRALDIVVFPNQGAGLGRPVLEAAAYGLPVVASGSPDGAGVLDSEVTGLLVPRADPEDLAAAIERLVADDALRKRLGEAAAAHARLVAEPRVIAARVEAAWSTSL
jgi:glycosyltransferase involved in cell wall biosynthesis